MSVFGSRLGGFVGRRPRVVLVAGLILTVGLAAGIPRLEFETSQESLIGEDSPVARDNRVFQEAFGGEVMVALFTAEPDHRVEDLFAGDNRQRLESLGSDLSELDAAFTVITPLTTLELSAAELEIGQQLLASAGTRVRAEAGSAAAGEAAAQEITERLLRDAERFGAVQAEGLARGLDDPLTFENPAFVEFLLYGDAEQTEIRVPLRSAFPDPSHALAVVRLEGNLDIGTMGEGADAIEDVIGSYEFDGFEVMATGSPVLLRAIDDYLGEGMVTLGALAVGVMIFVLFFVFRVRRRLLPLVMVVLGAIWAFGIMGFSGIPLTLITISGLPILIGVGVDFAIQTHSRFEEEIDTDGACGPALERLMRGLAPALAVAAAAAAAGFLALQISAVPQIRDFGVMLAVGIGALFAAGLLITSALLAWGETRRPTPAGGACIPHGTLERVVRRTMSVSARRALPLALVGVLVVVVGLSLEGRFAIETEPERWLPQDGQAVQGLEELREATGTSSDVTLLIEADDVMTDDVAQWMVEFGEAQVAEHPDALLRHASIATTVSEVTGVPPTADEVEQVIEIAPADIVRSLVSDDRTRAALIFPVGNISLDARSSLLDEMRADLATGSVGGVELATPAGADVTPAGLAVVGIEVVEALGANRTLITWAATGAVVLLLLLVFRSLAMTALPLVPVLIATGLSSIVTWASGITLSPITAVTTPLVIATCTEFSVLIMTRYVEDRRRGLDPEAAVEHGAVRIGRAFTASGLTTIGGFAVLAISSFSLLRDFGVLIALNVSVALVSALVVLPPLLVWADRNPRLTRFTPGSLPTARRRVPEDHDQAGPVPIEA